GGIDLLDDTPVLDIKPYLPYADSIPVASGGYADAAPPPGPSVIFSPAAQLACQQLSDRRHCELEKLVTSLLRQDPRPAYRGDRQPTCYGMRLWDLNIRFRVTDDQIVVETVEPIDGNG
ncbi:MAG: SAM-dependent methyltransferase, partial [Desulfatitalea sp.]|nr:SAM-dependent methyltransferase [Desulfatitalea sp.]